MWLPITLGESLGRGHFYLAETRTFLLCVDRTANGGRRANVTGIPSPASLSNIVARILAFTGAGGASFFYTTGFEGAPQMQVFDNSASSFVVDFSDTALLAGISADSLFQLVELGECAGVIGHAERVFW